MDPDHADGSCAHRGFVLGIGDLGQVSPTKTVASMGTGVGNKPCANV